MDNEFPNNSDKLHLIEKIMYLRRNCYDNCNKNKAQCERYSYRHLIGNFLKNIQDRAMEFNTPIVLPTIEPFIITSNISHNIEVVKLTTSSSGAFTFDINDIQIYKFLDSERKQDTSIVNGYMYGRSVNSNIPSLDIIDNSGKDNVLTYRHYLYLSCRDKLDRLLEWHKFNDEDIQKLSKIYDY